MGRKHCGKRRNCSLRAISPFSTVFLKDLGCRHIKRRACLGKGVFKRLVLQTRKNQGLLWKGLKLILKENKTISDNIDQRSDGTFCLCDLILIYMVLKRPFALGIHRAIGVIYPSAVSLDWQTCHSLLIYR